MGLEYSTWAELQAKAETAAARETAGKTPSAESTSTANDKRTWSYIDLSKAPYDVLVHILSFVDHKTQVFSCRLVNSQWRAAVECESLRKHNIILKKIPKNFPMHPWHFYYHCANGLLGETLINTNILEGWDMVPANYQYWNSEDPPDMHFNILPGHKLLEVDDPRTRHVCCLVSTHRLKANTCVIDLCDHMVPSFFWNKISPVSKVILNYVTVKPTKSAFEMKVLLCTRSSRCVEHTQSFSIEPSQLAKWHSLEIVFEERLIRGISYIRLEHNGKFAAINMKKINFCVFAKPMPYEVPYEKFIEYYNRGH